MKCPRSLLLAACLGSGLAAPVFAGDWQDFVYVSSTLGNVSNRLCSAAPSNRRPADIGCPSYSPYLTSGGLLGVGTSSPTATLQVSGSFIVSNTTQTTSASLYVATNGNVGIGTVSPQDVLQVTQGDSNHWRFSSDASLKKYYNTEANPRWSIVDYGWANPVFTGLLLNTSGNSSYAFNGTAIGMPSAQTLAMFTSNGSSLIERMRITSGSTVGIGTTNPNANLEVSGTISATHFVGDGSGLANLSVNGDRITSGTTNLVAISNTAYVSLTQNGTNTGWFDPTRGLITLGVSATGGLSGTTGYFSGNVGIGTTTPAGSFNVVQGIGATLYFDAYTSSTASGVGLAMRQARGTLSAPTASQANDRLFSVGGRGYGTTGFSSLTRASVKGWATENWTDTVQGTYLTFGTTTAGTASETERMRIDNVGNIGIGTISPDSPLTVNGNTSGLPAPGVSYTGTNLHIVGTDGVKSRILVDSFGAGSFPVLSLRAARGTAGSPTALQTGDTFGTLNAGGYGSSAYGGGAAQISFITTDNWTNSDNGSAIRFLTVANGSTSLVDRMRIDNNGNVGIGITSPNANLEVSGTISATHFVGDGSGLSGLAASGDQINSGTASVIANLNTGISVSTPLDVSGALKLSGLGSETCDAAHQGTIRTNPVTGGVEVCRP